MEVIRTALVADHRLFVEALKRCFAREPDLFVLPPRRTSEPDFVPQIRASRPHVIVVVARGLALPWPRVGEQLGKALPDCGQVLVADEDDARDVVAAVRAGFGAWLSPHAGTAAVIEAVRGVRQGHAHYPPDHLGALLRDVRRVLEVEPAPTGPVTALSQRELEVLACLVEGWPSALIAEHLAMAPNTVRTHTNRIFRKLAVHSRLEAVRVAREAGLTPGRAARYDARTSAPGDDPGQSVP
ncbi:response regulator transcription factor [Actinomycetospora atypica]|uniref:LuxR C-terminal-related transcriptional regulator n=1 Tax=Actinomycetospora atypica TaxID=1290095 RepID=A0ABV9YIB1_9PSEU